MTRALRLSSERLRFESYSHKKECSDMKIAVISVTENGNKISRRIAEGIGIACDRFAFSKHCDGSAVPFDDMKQMTAKCFGEYDGIIFICACGIAVRMVAPHVVSKLSDPAVVVIDESGKFAISLLSGHIGKANALTEKAAEIIGAEPVITTATDVGGKFSPDSFAAANDLYICEYDIAKEIAAETANGGNVGFYSDIDCMNTHPFCDNKRLGICISSDTTKMPFEHTLHLIPKDIIIGAGCKKGTSAEKFELFLLSQLAENKLDIRRVKALCTIDIKREENAILTFCHRHNIPLHFYSAAELMAVDGQFTSSEFVLKTTGADNICERSAMVMGKRLLVKKQAMNGMTFAAAEAPVKIDFNRRVL